ncbi:MAG: DUF2339 domain-containing protein [Acidobacteriota bacterium]|nr:DUF2339 domain-containing protein [Acidobacteriota bacterium]
MPQDDPTDAGGDHIDARLAQIERAVGQLSARLRAVEDRLGAAPQSHQHEQDARPFGQGATTHTRTEVDHTSVVDGSSFTPHAARDEGAPAEDYPFNIPPRVADESQKGSASHSPEFGASFAESRAGEGQDRGGSARADRIESDAASAERDGARADRVEGGAGAAAVAVRARRDLETLVGGSLFNWLGIVAVTLSVGFFLKYAFDNQWIGPAGRVLLGAAAGCALLALAERLRARGYRAYAHVLTGGGILILYLSTYAARVFYDLIGLAPAFALMSLVTATAVVLAVRYDALAVAVLALVGGFMTPALLSTGVDKQIALFSYVAFLDAGVLAVAYFKRWRVLDHLAFAATALTFAAWALAYYESWKDLRTLFFLTLFFLMFSALALLHNVLRRRHASLLDVSLLLSNSALYFAAAYLVVGDRHDDLLGAFSLAAAVFHSLLYLFARARHREDRRLASAYVVATSGLLLVAVGTQFDRQWTTIGWSAEALLLTWFGLRQGERAARYCALVVFAAALEHWFTIDLRDFAFDGVARFVPLLNARAFSCAALVASLAAAIYFYRRHAECVDKDEREIVAAVLALAANALALTLLSCDAVDYFSSAALSAGESDWRAQSLRNDSALALTVLWAVYASAAFAVGLRRNLAPLRYAALAWLAVTGFKLLLRDATFYDAPWHAPVFNQTFAAFVAFVAAVWYVAHSYAGAEGIDVRERRTALTALAVVGNLFAVAALSLEASGYFRKQPDALARAGGAARDLRLARQLSLSLVWAVYGGATLAYGHARQNKPLRLLALALLAATTLKVFFYDLAGLERFYRIVSFVALGVVLLAVSFLYQQRQRRAREDESS